MITKTKSSIPQKNLPGHQGHVNVVPVDPMSEGQDGEEEEEMYHYEGGDGGDGSNQQRHQELRQGDMPGGEEVGHNDDGYSYEYEQYDDAEIVLPLGMDDEAHHHHGNHGEDGDGISLHHHRILSP
jgi:hypothetical protein